MLILVHSFFLFVHNNFINLKVVTLHKGKIVPEQDNIKRYNHIDTTT